ncbi:AMP-binding protein [Vibrio fluvialis]|uniref:AMP-binding protein n=1 Tax=Vibrio fluvialis TaxID=676 RepID=UPI00215C7EB1|nr:AMP-binding protein [Vibrio fluvialis]MCR9298792.1 AMP-binding protein [Vibrio fluvialis]
MISFIEKMQSYQEQIALCFDSDVYTYSELVNNIAGFQAQLEPIESGSVVGLISDYSFDAISVFLALAEKKCIVVPIVSENTEEITKRLEVVEPDVVINLRFVEHSYDEKGIKSDRHPLISQLREDKHSGLVLFSSGSTGQPKAMVHDLDILLSSYLEKKSKSLSIMVFLMFDHIGGLNTLLNSLSMGAKIVVPGKREPEHVAALIEREKINLLPASPTFLNMMVIADVFARFDLRSLRMVTYGTEAMPESLLRKLKLLLPRVKLLQTFGTSETGISQTSSRSSDSLELRFDDKDQEIRIVDNELWVRSKTQILGYLNHDMDSFSEDGWFKTGDLVEETSDGYLKIVGRIKEIINVGGEKVLPSEVESVVLEVDGVMDCMAFSAPNAITGQTVAINVSIRQGIDPKECKKIIRKHCKQNLDGYKVPTKVTFSSDTGVSNRFKKIRIKRQK